MLLLDLSLNKIKQLPDDLKELSLIETLNLSDNRIDEIPISLCDLINLKCLSLSNNNIRSLPNQFCQLTRLDWNRSSTLSNNCLSGNPLEYPSLDKICSLGLTEIFKFLQNENESIREYDLEENDKITNLVSASKNFSLNSNQTNETYTEITEIRIPIADLDDIDDLDD